ncbi:MAG: bacterial transcriptional activator domain-containing protein [candidate division Zixibacteria bacterium]|nr:bacterial transcriptional activator domain-containing protein [candidate division Zixibacteria bacterium]
MNDLRTGLVLSSQEYLFNDQFDSSITICRAYIGAHPDDPLGYLFCAISMMGKMADAEEHLYDEQYHAMLNATRALAEHILDSCDNRTAAWMHLFEGHTVAYRSLYESRFGSFVKAVKLGLAADNHYTKGLQADSTLIDLYAGLGSYHYWKSAKAGFLRWIGLFKNEKDRGIAELRRAAESSLVHREVARSSLIWIWLDREEYDSAAATASLLLDLYPHSRTLLWPLAQARYRQESYPQALETFRRIRDRLQTDPGNYYNLIECDYYIVDCLDRLNLPAEATAAARVLGDYYANIGRPIMKKQQDKIRALQKTAARQND